MTSIRGRLTSDQLAQLKQRMGPGVLNEQARLFRLVRRTDVSGVSGTGTVAEGIQFRDGTVAMRWLSQTPTTTIFDNLDDLLRIHGHGGTTEVVWD